MNHSRYHDAVVAKRRRHGFDVVDVETDAFDTMWATRDDDPTLGNVYLLATVVNGDALDPADVERLADRLRELLADRADRHDRAVTPIGYMLIAADGPDDALIDRATDYTVAEQRTNVFPLVYDRAELELHTHSVPRLKGRGIYRRQVEDAERLFDV